LPQPLLRRRHEGGFTIRRDGAGALYFQRPDGRVIPRFGYRLDDVCDDYAVDDDPSMEVGEPRALYCARLPHGLQQQCRGDG
jgi:hypothetical protein